MSTEYNRTADVPDAIIASRLMELSDIIANGFTGTGEFTMRVPAECDRDADLVLADASRRVLENTTLTKLVTELEEENMNHSKNIVMLSNTIQDLLIKANVCNEVAGTPEMIYAIALEYIGGNAN